MNIIEKKLTIGELYNINALGYRDKKEDSSSAEEISNEIGLYLGNEKIKNQDDSNVQLPWKTVFYFLIKNEVWYFILQFPAEHTKRLEKTLEISFIQVNN